MENAVKRKLSVAVWALAGLAVAAVAVALVAWFVESASDGKGAARCVGHPYAGADAPSGEFRPTDGKSERRGDEGEEAGGESGESGMVGVEEGKKNEEELRAEDEEKKVDAFDSLTDKWMEKDGGTVTMKDMDAFVAAFKSVPGKRKDECLHRALNLVSDDHVLLLAGILFDKTVEKEYIELVFNDILNRDEGVKELILPRIFKDRTHPCWADTAWILDVTGKTPNKENSNE